MENIRFSNNQGDFELTFAEKAPGTYFPLVNESGIISSITPLLSGDCKMDQNTFLLAPASEQTLTESRASRNFWIAADNAQLWSAAGQSAAQQAKRFSKEAEHCVLTGGLLWQKVTRKQAETGLKAEILSFVPSDKKRVEIMRVTVTNEGSKNIRFKAVVAIPVYGRSADDIRDHRHVTSLLHRVKMESHGIAVSPTLSFDERGHKKCENVYRVLAAGKDMQAPQYAVPMVKKFCGEGGYDWPQAVVAPDEAKEGRIFPGETAKGGEVVGALFFDYVTLAPGESTDYQVLMSIDENPVEYLNSDAVEKALERTKKFWAEKACGDLSIANKEFSQWMKWVSVQPVLRRICGCSFMPHHDYGRGGRGWRDLWQDSLGLVLTEPNSIRQSLLSHFGGVRVDGTNATIIGNKPGEFKADRNNIPRVWMDHGFWPLLTVNFYLNETGDYNFLFEERPYFADGFSYRGEPGHEKENNGEYSGSVLEHLLIQNVTAFFDVGEHGHIKLRGADWNDGLDMAVQRGESVAFTAAYAGNLALLSELIDSVGNMGFDTFDVSSYLCDLMEYDCGKFGDVAEMQKALTDYCKAAYNSSNNKKTVSGKWLSEKLRGMSDYIKKHIRETEWVGDNADQHWFNGYYDNSGNRTEGLFGDKVRMMLTGQVFTLMSGVATDEQAESVIRAADWYLFDPGRGGYCLNTDFDEVKLDLGRMFGFAYGHKENGAVFCHMAVMYAFALYSRGFALEGWKVLECLFKQSIYTKKSEILPGIPEYFDDEGRGMYPYLTGAASWLNLTVQTQMFGVRGNKGNLILNPKLTAEQFDSQGKAAIACSFAGCSVNVEYRNPKHLEWGGYRIGNISVDGKVIAVGDNTAEISRDELKDNCNIVVTLEPIC